MQPHLEALCRHAMRHIDRTRTTDAAGLYPSPLPRVAFAFVTQPNIPLSRVYEPMLCMVLQGAKQTAIGERVIRYDTATCLLTSLELPATAHVIEASPERPYVCVTLRFERQVLADLLAAAPAPTTPRAAPAHAVTGFAVAPVTSGLLAAWEHLLALLDSPADIPVLAPLRERELLYRLAQGPHGEMLRQLALEDSRLSRVRRTMQFMQNHFDQTLRVDVLAAMAGMSVPVFHRHFKAATAMSPVQFQKALRLQAARRLLMAQASASHAAYTVGYESASQFSRDYARMFGEPPSRDKARLRRLESV